MIALGWLCLSTSGAAAVLLVVGLAHDVFGR